MAGKKKLKKQLREMEDRVKELEDQHQNRHPTGEQEVFGQNPPGVVLNVFLVEEYFLRVFNVPRQPQRQTQEQTEATDERAADAHAQQTEGRQRERQTASA